MLLIEIWPPIIDNQLLAKVAISENFRFFPVIFRFLQTVLYRGFDRFCQEGKSSVSAYGGFQKIKSSKSVRMFATSAGSVRLTAKMEYKNRSI